MAMIDKKLLVILILLAGYVVLIRPIIQKAAPEWAMVNIIRKSIAKESFIASQEKKIKRNFPAYQKIIKWNEALFFSPNTSLTTDRSRLQKMLKKMLQMSGLIIVKINWGEVLNEGGYMKLPISFVAHGTPVQLERFFEYIKTAKKLMKFEQVSITKYRIKGLLVEAIIVGYKRGVVSHVKR